MTASDTQGSKARPADSKTNPFSDARELELSALVSRIGARHARWERVGLEADAAHVAGASHVAGAAHEADAAHATETTPGPEADHETRAGRTEDDRIKATTFKSPPSRLTPVDLATIVEVRPDVFPRSMTMRIAARHPAVTVAVASVVAIAFARRHRSPALWRALRNPGVIAGLRVAVSMLDDRPDRRDMRW